MWHVSRRKPFSFLAVCLVLVTATSACRLSANNGEKLTALKSGQAYDEDGVLTVDLTWPSAGAFINAQSNSVSYAVTGTCSLEGAPVSLLIDEVEAVSHVQAVCSGGLFSTFLDTTSLNQGPHTLKAVIRGSSTGESQSDPIDFSKDTGIPTVAITSPSSGVTVNAAQQSSRSVSGTCDESGRTVRIFVNSTDSSSDQTGGVCDGSTWSATINLSQASKYPDGALSLSARLSDSAGNEGASSAVSITKDATPPSIAITTPAANAFINDAAKSAFTVSGSCSTSENGRSVTIQVNGASATQTAMSCNSSGAWTGTIDVSALSEGAKALSAVISDVAGNSTPSAAVAVTKDTSAPSVALSAPASSTLIQAHNNRTTYAVSGTCDEAGQTVAVKVNGANATSQSGGVCGSGAWSATIDVTALTDAATHTISATLSDPAGNSGSTSSPKTVSKDLSKPGSTTFSRTSVASDLYTGVQAASGIPRFSAVSDSRGILLEDSSTNLFTYSTDFTNAVWSKQFVTVTADATTSPSGSLTADKLDATDTNSAINQQISASASTTYTCSVWLRADTPFNTRLLLYDGTTYHNNPISLTTSWQRFSITRTTGASATTFKCFIGGDNTFSTGQSMYAWGAQIEQKPYATSFVATSTATASRSAETLTLPTEGILNANEGAVIVRAYVDGELVSTSSTGQPFLLDIRASAGTNVNRIALWLNGHASYRAQTRDAAGTLSSVTHSSALSVGWHTFGVRWTSSKLSFYIDGSEVGTAVANPTLPATLASTMYLGSALSSPAYQWGQPIDYYAFYQNAPTEAAMLTYTGSAGPSNEDYRLDFNGASISRATTAYDTAKFTQVASGKERYATVGGATGIVIEEGTTNLVQYATEFDNAYWVKTRSSVTADVTTAPDGTTTADKLNEATVTGQSRYIGVANAFTVGQPGTISVFAKAAERSQVALVFVFSSTTYTAIFNLDSGTVASKGSGVDRATIQSVGNGWYRCTATITSIAGSATYANIATAYNNYIYNDGTAGSGVYIWGAQAENKDYATSWHLANATRNAETLVIPTANLLNASSGKIRMRFMLTRSPGSATIQNLFDAGGGGNVNGLFLETIPSSGLIALKAGNGTGLQTATSTTVFTKDTWYTIEGSWNSSQIALKVNGVTEATTTMTPSINLTTNMGLGSMLGAKHLDGLIDWIEFEKSDGSVQRLDFSQSLSQ